MRYPPLTTFKNNELHSFLTRYKFTPSNLSLAVILTIPFISMPAFSIGWTGVDEIDSDVGGSVYFNADSGVIPAGINVTGAVSGTYGDGNVSTGALVNYGNVDGGILYGGYSDSGTVKDCFVFLAGGTVSGTVYGGYSNNGSDANGNAITILGDVTVMQLLY